MERQFTQIAKGLKGAEGPVFDREGQFFMVAPGEGRIVRVEETGEVSTYADTEGIPAGLQVDRENALWCADMRRGILRIPAEGQVEPIVTEYDGQPIRGCNDCIFDSQGNLYFTAPGGSSATTPVGEIFCRTVDGTVTRLDGGFRFCNGIAVSADDRYLFVAETFTKKVWRYAIHAPGSVGEKEDWATLPGEHRGGPDGMDFDADGRLLVTNHGAGSIDVFDADGNLVDRIKTPFDKPSNVHFGGDDNTWVYVTEHDEDGLWKFQWERPGQPQYSDR